MMKESYMQTFNLHFKCMQYSLKSKENPVQDKIHSVAQSKVCIHQYLTNQLASLQSNKCPDLILVKNKREYICRGWPTVTSLIRWNYEGNFMCPTCEFSSMRQTIMKEKKTPFHRIWISSNRYFDIIN